MDIGTVVGLVLAVAAIGIAVVIGGGGNVMALVDPTSVFVVIIGAAGAVVISFPLARITGLVGVVKKSFFNEAGDPAETIAELVKYAEVARREGILSLENLMSEMKDPFIVRGVKMAVDGTDPELIQTILDTELDALTERHQSGKAVLDALAKYAPAFGMIGTLLGLIFMLKSMDDPSKIGPGMAVALITTLYGALIANLFASPIADKLAAKDAEEMLVKTIIVTGVMSIQSGDNPRVVESKLLTFLPPAQRDAFTAAREAA
ncbi:flagellar motor protein MotP [Leptolyngbya valderiana BDU 20041]|nr:flagellar motor protein MotP [Leptolyngbya valderiana BDU 20041]